MDSSDDDPPAARPRYVPVLLFTAGCCVCASCSFRSLAGGIPDTTSATELFGWSYLSVGMVGSFLSSN